MKFKPSPKRKEKAQQKEKSGIRTKLNFILKRKAPPKETKNQLPVEINKAALTFKEFYPVHAPFGYAGIEADERTGNLQYLVIEPTMNSQEQEVLEEIKKHLKTEIVVPLDVLHDEKRTDEFLSKHIQKVIRKFKLAVSSDAVNKFLYYVKRDFLGYGAIDILIRDQNIEDISCNGANVPVYVWHRKYESLETNIIYPFHEELDAFITRLAYKTGHQISVARPILEGTLPEGFRAHLTLDEVSKRGDTFTIRKIKADPYTIVDLLKFGTTSPQMGAYFWVLVENLRSIMVAGATASGKTAFLNAIGMFIKPEMKVVTIEEVREIRLHDNWIPMVARPSFQAGVQEVTLYDLLKSSLRQRPDYIVVGEVRGEEAYTLFQSIAVGHGGLCLSKNEVIPFIENGRFRISTIEELVEGILSNKVKNAKIFSFSPSNWKIELNNIKRVFKVPSSGSLFAIKLEGGKKFEVSPDHPLLVLTAGGLVTKPAKEAKIGDYIPLVKRLPSLEIQNTIDLPDLIGNDSKIYVLCEEVIKRVGLPEARKALSNMGCNKYQIYDWLKRKAAMPMLVYLAFEKSLNLEKYRNVLRLKFGAKAKNYNSVPAVLALNEPLAKMFGWYLAEGRVSQQVNVKFSLGPHEHQYAEDLYDAIKTLGLRPTIKKQKTNILITAYSKLLAITFLKLFGTGAQGKDLPSEIFHAPKEFKEVLVKTYWMGNGNQAKRGKETWRFSVDTTSERLAKKLFWLLKTLDVDLGLYELPPRRGRINNREIIGGQAWRGVVLGGNGLLQFAKLFGFKVKSYHSFVDTIPAFLAKSKTQNQKRLLTKDNLMLKEKFLTPPAGNIYFLKIISKTEKPYADWFYDVETEKGNFVHSTGIFTHNCTIHSESVETVVKRLLTQPMNIPPMLIPLMNVIVHIGRTKRGNTVARRVMEVAEITDINQQTGAAVFSPVFKWNSKTDSFDFMVEDPRKDFILQKIASTRYIPIDDLVAEIERRSAILKWMVKKDIHTYDEVAKVVREYYIDPARVLNKVGLEGTMTK
jgi:flagellar protein FlaI